MTQKEKDYMDEVSSKIFIGVLVYLEMSFLISLGLYKFINNDIGIETLLSISSTITFVSISLISLILGKMDDTVLGKSLKKYLYEDTYYFYSIYIAIILFILQIIIYFLLSIKFNINETAANYIKNLLQAVFILTFFMNIIVIVYCINATIKMIVNGNDFNRDKIENSFLDLDNILNNKNEFEERINNIIFETELLIKNYDSIKYDKNVKSITKILVKLINYENTTEKNSKSYQVIKEKVIWCLIKIIHPNFNKNMNAKDYIMYLIESGINTDAANSQKLYKDIQGILKKYRSITKQNLYIYINNEKDVAIDKYMYEYSNLAQINNEMLKKIYWRHILETWYEIYIEIDNSKKEKCITKMSKFIREVIKENKNERLSYVTTVLFLERMDNGKLNMFIDKLTSGYENEISLLLAIIIINRQYIIDRLNNENKSKLVNIINDYYIIVYETYHNGTWSMNKEELDFVIKMFVYIFSDELNMISLNLNKDSYTSYKYFILLFILIMIRNTDLMLRKKKKLNKQDIHNMIKNICINSYNIEKENVIIDLEKCSRCKNHNCLKEINNHIKRLDNKIKEVNEDDLKQIINLCSKRNES